MIAPSRAALVLAALLASPAMGQGAGPIAERLSGRVLGYAAGTGITIANPRIETEVTFCTDGRFRARGRSCRPAVIETGLQCTNFAYEGTWRLEEEGRIGHLHWTSPTEGEGIYRIRLGEDGRLYADDGRPLPDRGAAEC